MRLIDADALLEKFNKKVDIWTALTDEHITGDFAFYCNLADAIDEMPTIGWISVKDRLPEIDEDVLILYESKVSRKTGYAITCIKDTFYFGSTPIPYQTPQWNEPWQYFRENNSITHWMPLPEPPKEDYNAD